MAIDMHPELLDEDDRKELQAGLAELHYYTGAIDGVWGPRSRAAYERLAAVRTVGTILDETDLTDAVRAEFARLWAAADILPDRLAPSQDAARRLLEGRPRYEAVQSSSGVPWFVVGAIHMREADFDFSTHLHNGDSLSARTVHVPAGRPATGRPPFEWAYSAADALFLDGLTRWTDWSLAGCLHKLEAYNGFGPRLKGRTTGYLWAGTLAYTGGKYVSDGVWDGNAFDEQPGCVAVLKLLVEQGAVKL